MIKANVIGPGGRFELKDQPIPEPGRGCVRVKVHACGVCHSDALTKDGGWPGIVYPRSPGHEIAGVIDALGADADPWKVGDRVGVGWFGGSCGRCNSCRRGDFITCVNLQIPGISYDGGYSEYVCAPVQALAHIPDQMRTEDAAPLMCAGIATFNALRHSGAMSGDLIAIQGVGGLGHLGIQFARKFGFETVAIGRGAGIRDLALQLGARAYLDTETQDVSKELTRLGGARVILATAPDGKAMGTLVDGLGVDGKLILLGVTPEPFAVSALQLLPSRKSIAGWPSGTATDSDDTLKFAAANGVRPMIETFSLDRVADAYEHMISGKVRFRAVLKM